MKLFDEIPYLANESVILKEITMKDAPQLHMIAGDPRVYVYLPTFLYEQKYKDAEEVIARMYEECFLPKVSIMLGIFLKQDPSVMTGIAEIYGYDELKNKTSIGYRLAQAYWHQGIALQTGLLLKDYLENIIRIRTITGHIMRHNLASARIAEKIGFENRFPGLWEDWGREGPVLIDKYVIKNDANPKQAVF